MPRAGKPCARTNCPNIVQPGTTYCPTCARARDKDRGTRQRRGYDRRHDAERRRWAPRVATGAVRCARCDEPITATEPWDLGHTDDRTRWTGPEHARCNRAAAGRSAHALRGGG
jgi:hypothetical protein